MTLPKGKVLGNIDEGQIRKKEKEKKSFDLIKENRPRFTNERSLIAIRVKHFWQGEP